MSVIRHRTFKPEQFHSSESLTSPSPLSTVVRRDPISLPESPRRWINPFTEFTVPRTLAWFELHLIVMCWRDVRLWNCMNLSWTTSTPEYSSYQTERNYFIINSEKTAHALRYHPTVFPVSCWLNQWTDTLDLSSGPQLMWNWAKAKWKLWFCLFS